MSEDPRVKAAMDALAASIEAGSDSVVLASRLRDLRIRCAYGTFGPCVAAATGKDIKQVKKWADNVRQNAKRISQALPEPSAQDLEDWIQGNENRETIIRLCSNLQRLSAGRLGPGEAEEPLAIWQELMASTPPRYRRLIGHKAMPDCPDPRQRVSGWHHRDKLRNGRHTDPRGRIRSIDISRPDGSVETVVRGGQTLDIRRVRAGFFAMQNTDGTWTCIPDRLVSMWIIEVLHPRAGP